MDGALTPGCESTCVGTACTLPGGGGITLTVPPPVERGGVFAEFHAGAALGAHVMSGGNLRNLGVLGGPPTAPVGESTGGNHRNVGAVVSLGP